MIDFSGYDPLVQGGDISGDVDTMLLAAVCDAVRLYCGWHIAPIAEHDVLKVTHLGNEVLVLPTKRVVEIESVVDADGVAITDFEVDESGLLRRPRAGWPYGYGSVTVTLTHGVSAAPPAIVAVVADILRSDARAILAPTSVSLDGASVSFEAASTAAQAELGRAYGHILDRFRL